MCSLFNVDYVNLLIVLYLFGQSAGSPRVKLSIREYDVANSKEVSLNIFATKVVPNPVISRCHLVLLLAVKCECVIVEGLR